MRVGLTYDLRSDYLQMGYSEEETAEFDRPDTVDAIESALQGLGHQTDRIGHLRQLVGRLAKGDRWDLVFNICEGLYGIGREAQVPSLLDAFSIPYTFSDPLVLSLTLHKGMTKRVVRDMGILTPDFRLVERGEDVDAIDLPFPLFLKPVAEGTGKGITAKSKITSRDSLREECLDLLLRFHQPVLVERFLPGREFTVGIVGTAQRAEVIGTVEVVLKEDAEADVYSYHNKEKCEDLVLYRRSDDDSARRCADAALRAWKGLGCRDAGRVDMRLDENGDAHFLEVNPLAGLHPEHSDLPIICAFVGISYAELIRRIVASAETRMVHAG